MQKILVIGPGSVGIAAQMQLLSSSHHIIALEDTVCIHPPEPEIAVHEPIAFSHSFDGYHYPTREEADWVNKLGEEVGQRASVDYHIQSLMWDEVAKGVPFASKAIKHRSEFTKSQPTRKARKAARKRAKAGRKASR